ncbi:MAG: cytochrome C peroxidase [Saprospiraceae bacterium]|nr:cytochrome C peroxidase [Saprospiraceae bacterium]
MGIVLPDSDWKGNYSHLVLSNFQKLGIALDSLELKISNFNSSSSAFSILDLRNEIHKVRVIFKKSDPWLRYFEPILFKMINGPLLVEWEVEAFEKFELPYKREGAGLLLMEEYLNEEDYSKDSLLILCKQARNALVFYEKDSILRELRNPENVLLVNRLFLLNLASIYTTGFECPDTSRIIPELKVMLTEYFKVLSSFNDEFRIFDNTYFKIFKDCLIFLDETNGVWLNFNHFDFIRSYVDPLFVLNQKQIQLRKVESIAYNEYSLSNSALSIFDKRLFFAQDFKGVFRSVKDSGTQMKIIELGEQLFYDPLLSGNNKRSCASCHIPGQYFTDTTLQTSRQFNYYEYLERNTPTLINSSHSQLIRMDGRHFSFFNQTKDVLKNSIELNTDEKTVERKVLSCQEYKSAFKKYLPLSSELKFSLIHISSAIGCYLDQFEYNLSDFDSMMLNYKESDELIQKGFNLFMGKAQCGTCHFVPGFGGLKPPFLTNEFEVLGVPEDTSYQNLSNDLGRFEHFKSSETHRAFKTPTLRNIFLTKPYMHNGVFGTLDQVLDFYNQGGGKGRKLDISNQTLSEEKLNLTSEEIYLIKTFMNSLTEKINLNYSKPNLPKSNFKKLNSRISGGEY